MSQHHQGRHEQAADDRGVERDRDGQSDAELLDGRAAGLPEIPTGVVAQNATANV